MCINGTAAVDAECVLDQANLCSACDESFDLNINTSQCIEQGGLDGATSLEPVTLAVTLLLAWMLR
jgi:hypothetical protein